MYVELFDEASKYVLIVGICARRNCGADTGGGCSASQTPCHWRHSGDAFTAYHREHWKLPCKWRGLAFSYLEASGSATHAERNCCSRDQEAFCQYEQSHRSGQSRVRCIRFPLNATPLNERNLWSTTIRSFPIAVHNVVPRCRRTERTTHPRSPAATFPTHHSAPYDAFADSHRVRDVSLPTSPVVPLFPASPPPISHPAGPTVSRSHDFPHPRRPGRWDARPLHGIYTRENVNVVAVFFAHHRLFRRPEPRHPAERAAAGRAVPSLSTSGRLTEEGGKERALSSVLTSADPIPEADARRQAM